MDYSNNSLPIDPRVVQDIATSGKQGFLRQPMLLAQRWGDGMPGAIYNNFSLFSSQHGQ